MGEKPFRADGSMVLRTEDEQDVCTCNPHIEGAAEEIADALNIKAGALDLLLRAAGELKLTSGAGSAGLELAAEIEEFLVQ